MNEGHPRRSAFPRVLILVFLMAGCTAATPPEKPNLETKEPEDPFAQGVLQAVANFAPANSTSQNLSQIAEQFGWGQEVAQNGFLRKAIVEGKFAERVEPFLVSLFFRKGFSVLPLVGEGHQFSRDSIVRGGIAGSTFLVTTRERVRIIFLTPPENLQIIYPQDGTPPQVFTPKDGGVLSVRKSRLGQYLR